MIAIINYGMGNLTSVKNALDFVGAQSVIVDNAADLKTADKIILPGVGAFGMAMNNLNELGFADAMKEQVLVNKKPILGICLGMQLLFETSTEHGKFEGLGIIKGHVKFFGDYITSLPIPHVGWNEVDYESSATLFKSAGKLPAFYFVHSYFCEVSDETQIAGKTDYGIVFHSACEHENIFGCQFHPEKSQQEGLAIYKNFDGI